MIVKRKQYPKVNVFLLAVSLTVLITGCQKDLQTGPNDINQELEKSLERGFDGIIVYVNQGGKSTFYSAGLNNREDQIPADPNSLFRIASISKLYIAAATTKLIASQDLNVDSKLADLLPEVNGRIEYADKITLKMMLGHRSGIPEYIYQPGFETDTDEDYLTTASLIFDQPADFKPDKKYGYCNTNYLLIGAILDKTLGYSHHEFIKNEILLPLNLNNTYSLFSEVSPSEVMSGYVKGLDSDVKLWDHTGPGGSMVATAEDVGLFLRALIDGSLFTEEEQAIYSSVYEYEHTGWLNGYTSIARYHIDIDAVVVQFVNTSGTGMFWIELEEVYSRIVKTLEKQY